MSVKLKWGAKGGAKPQMGGHGPPGPPPWRRHCRPAGYGVSCIGL